MLNPNITNYFKLTIPILIITAAGYFEIGKNLEDFQNTHWTKSSNRSSRNPPAPPEVSSQDGGVTSKQTAKLGDT